jgi:hypothetical protein
MSIIMQLIQDINNQMIYFERKGIIPSYIIEASTQVATRNFKNMPTFNQKPYFLEHGVIFVKNITKKELVKSRKI